MEPLILFAVFVLVQSLRNYNLGSGDENTDAGWLRFSLVETLMFIHMSSQSFSPIKRQKIASWFSFEVKQVLVSESFSKFLFCLFLPLSLSFSTPPPLSASLLPPATSCEPRFVSAAQQHGLLRELPGGGGPGGRRRRRRGGGAERERGPISRRRGRRPDSGLLLLVPLNTPQGQTSRQAAAQRAR